MGNSKTDYWLSTLQYIVASLVVICDLFALFDVVNFGSYDRYSAEIGPTAAVTLSDPFPLALVLWLAGILLGVVSFCAVLCKNHRLTMHLAVAALVCITFVMFIGWADLHAKPILGIVPTNFYLAYIIMHGLLALVSWRMTLRVSTAK